MRAIWRMILPGFAVILWLVFFLTVSIGSGQAVSSDATEIDLVGEAARKYFEAEMREDFRAVYDMLAPSSDYRRTHTYKEYLAEANASDARVIDYRIIRIDGPGENTDREGYPGIQSFARVEIEVRLFYRDTGGYDTINFSFTFIKEGNRWFKG